MKKLTVSKNAYYQNQWEHKGYLITELTDVSYLIWENNNVIKVCRSSIEAAEYIDKITAPNPKIAKEYYFINDTEGGALYTGVSLSDTASVSFVPQKCYLKAVAFSTIGRAKKYIEKYLSPFTDISKLEPVAFFIDPRDEKNLNECMFLDIQ